MGCQVEMPGGREGDVYTVEPRRPKIGKKPREKNSSVLDTEDALWQYNVYPSDHIGRPARADSKLSLILQAEAGCQHPVHEGAPGGLEEQRSGGSYRAYSTRQISVVVEDLLESPREPGGTRELRAKALQCNEPFQDRGPKLYSE